MWEGLGTNFEPLYTNFEPVYAKFDPLLDLRWSPGTAFWVQVEVILSILEFW